MIHVQVSSLYIVIIASTSLKVHNGSVKIVFVREKTAAFFKSTIKHSDVEKKKIIIWMERECLYTQDYISD